METLTVLYPRSFWSRCTGLVTQKNKPNKNSSSTLPKVLFFYQTDKLISFVLGLLKAGLLRRLFWITYGMAEENQGDFTYKKKKNMQQQPNLDAP